MATTPFIWGSNGQKLSPGQVEAMRAVAAARSNRPVATNFGEGLAALGDALVFNANMGRANEAESEGQQRVAQALADAQASGDPNSFYSVISDPWASEGQRLVAGTILNRQNELSDRSALWGREDAQRDEDRANALSDRDALWGHDATVLQEDRDYNQPLRDLQLAGAGIQNETGQFNLDQAREGFHQLVTPEERAAAGIPADDLGMYQVDASGQISPVGGKGGQTINVNNGGDGDSALDKALSENEGKAWSGLKDAAAVAGGLGQDLQILDELMKVAPQGPIVGPLAETFKGFSSAGDAFQSVVKRVAPSLRAPGSGATSDIEYDGFLRSLPALANSPEANAMINTIMKAKAALNVERGDIVTAYQNDEISVREARSRLAELNKRSIMTPEMKKALLGVGVTDAVDPEVDDLVTKYTGG